MAKLEPKSAEAIAIVPIGRGICADMILLPHLAAKVLEKFDHNTMQIGQSRYYRRALFAGDLCGGRWCE